MASTSLFIDDCLAKASPMLARMRADGLTETEVPFAERTVLLWRSGAPTPDMDLDDLTDVFMVCPVSPSVLSRRARCSECASPAR